MCTQRSQCSFYFRENNKTLLICRVGKLTFPETLLDFEQNRNNQIMLMPSFFGPLLELLSQPPSPVSMRRLPFTDNGNFLFLHVVPRHLKRQVKKHRRQEYNFIGEFEEVSH